MKKIFLFSFIALVFSSCSFKTNIYKPADFDSKTNGIKTIAVLPFKITTIGYPPRYISPEEVAMNNEKLAYSFQESLYNYLVLHNSEKNKTQVKSFQPLQKTIALLRQHHISAADIYQKQPEEIAQLLGVDAVILTNVEEHKNWDDKTNYKNSPAAPHTNEDKVWDAAKMNCYIYSSDQSELLWQTTCNGDTRLADDTASLIEYFTSWVGKHFPFHG
ncbi:hypothetical protein [Ferruginibacter sp.]